MVVGTFNPKRLERAMQRKGLTAADLAYEIRRLSGGRLKTTESQVYKWLRGKHVPTGGAVAVAAHAVDVASDELFEHDESDDEDGDRALLAEIDRLPASAMSDELRRRIRDAIERGAVELPAGASAAIAAVRSAR